SMLITNEDGDLEWATIEEIVQANETLTSMLQDDDTGIITYTPESGPATTANVVSGDDGNRITVGDDGGAYYALANKVVTVTATHVVEDDEGTVLINTPAGGSTITLPAAADSENRIIELRNMDTTGNIITLSANVTMANGITFTQFNIQGTIRIQSDGTNWYKIN
ncbi:hypothetical protein, partial [Parapedobacter soli]|uniref:hypothetical protein n=1 Tax=Parapedobacter soli TaxID=416955 RepID=UPI0021C91D88